MNDHPASDDGTDNDGRWPDGTPVLSPYPLTPEQIPDRGLWPWLPATILSQCGPDEWEVVIEDERAATTEEATGDQLHPIVFRDASELRLDDPTIDELREVFFPGDEDGGTP